MFSGNITRTNIKGERHYRFGNLEVLLLLNHVTVLCILAGIRLNLIANVVEVGILCYYEETKTRLNFENDFVFMLEKN